MKALRPLVLVLLAASTSGAPPPTRRQPTTDVYHGVAVSEDYRWLEDAGNPEVKAWVEAQNRETRAYLDTLAYRKPLRDRLKQLYAETSPSYYSLRARGGTLFAMKAQPPEEQSKLVALRSAEDPRSERVIVDPNTLKGGLSLDWYVPSADGSLVAVAMSEGGSEDASLHIFETATGRKRPDVIPRVNFPTAGGSAAWSSDASGFFYTRYPQGNERPEADKDFYQQVYYHRLGTASSEDAYALGREFPRVAEVQLQASEDGHHFLASVANGDGGEFEHWVRTPEGRWTRITQFDDRVVSAILGPDRALYLVSRQGAPLGKVLRLPLENPHLADAKLVVPEGEGSIEPPLLVTQTRLVVNRVVGGPSEAKIYDHGGKPVASLALPAVASLLEMVKLSGDELLFRVMTHLDPAAWYHVDASGRATRTALVTKSPVNLDDAEVVRETAPSKDGTRVPLTIIRRKGTVLDGTNPMLLTGYGGYGISMTPYFLGSFGRIWLDTGGVFAIANLRGGGEYGEAWHEAGKLTKKQNVFDDFIACAQHLIDRKYTSPAHLAIEGGSNGGLLMGAVLTQRPDLFRAVVSFVGIYDMLRVELDPNGAFNVTEFGSVKDAGQFSALFGYSPYHHVTPGVAYPAVFLLTGDNDGRVNPMHSRKMTARLQATTFSGRPILLRTSGASGHGFGTAASEAIEQAADVFAFLFDQLGIRDGASAGAPRN